MDISNIDLTQLSYAEIASIIRKDWGAKLMEKPGYYDNYVRPLFSINSLDDMYGCDTAYSVVMYARSNMSGWKGETAKAIRNELTRRLKAHKG